MFRFIWSHDVVYAILVSFRVLRHWEKLREIPESDDATITCMLSYIVSTWTLIKIWHDIVSSYGIRLAVVWIWAYMYMYMRAIIYWTKLITQLVNGSISVWICGVGQCIWDLLANYSQRIFGAWRVTTLLYGSLSFNLIGQNGFLCKRLKIKRFHIPYFSVRQIKWGISLENFLH